MSEDAITEYYFAKVVLIFNQIIRERTIIQLLVNPFVPNAPFVYPLKQKTLRLSVFWGYTKRALGTNGLNATIFF